MKALVILNLIWSPFHTHNNPAPLASSSRLDYYLLSSPLQSPSLLPQELPQLPALHHLLPPLLLTGLASYAVATAFFSVYAMAVDTLFLCFLEDLERNDGSRERPYAMSSSLRRVMAGMERAARRGGAGG